MAKAKKYKIIREYSSYSKRMGVQTKRHIWAKGLDSYDAAIAHILKTFPEAIIKDDIAINVGGVLYPTRLHIK